MKNCKGSRLNTMRVNNLYKMQTLLHEMRIILIEDVEIYGSKFQFVIHNLTDIVDNLVELERTKEYYNLKGTYEEL